MKCFACGEPRHRQSECKKASKRVPFVETDEGDDDDVKIKEQPVFDDEQPNEEEILTGNIGVKLVVRRSWLTLKSVTDDAWFRSNIFQFTCTILGKVCRFVIDGGSCKNIVLEEVVQ